jgi:hypothetical protein
MDRPLSLLHRIGLRTHLFLCQWCRRYDKQLRLLRQAVRMNPDQVNEAAPQGLSSDARERLKRSLLDRVK